VYCIPQDQCVPSADPVKGKTFVWLLRLIGGVPPNHELILTPKLIDANRVSFKSGEFGIFATVSLSLNAISIKNDEAVTTSELVFWVL
jgi:hypothetical protein